MLTVTDPVTSGRPPQGLVCTARARSAGGDDAEPSALSSRWETTHNFTEFREDTSQNAARLHPLEDNCRVHCDPHLIRIAGDLDGIGWAFATQRPGKSQHAWYV